MGQSSFFRKTWIAASIDILDDGLIASITDPRDNETTFEFDGLGRRILVTDAPGNEIETSHDEGGNAASWILREEPTGSDSTIIGTTSAVCDTLGRQIEESLAIDGQLSRTSSRYDAAGNRIQIDYPTRAVITRTFDAVPCRLRWKRPGGGGRWPDRAWPRK